MAKDSIDTPVPDPGKGKGNADSMPIKHYPGSTRDAQAGKKNTIDSPCDGDGLYHK